MRAARTLGPLTPGLAELPGPRLVLLRDGLLDGLLAYEELSPLADGWADRVGLLTATAPGASNTAPNKPSQPAVMARRPTTKAPPAHRDTPGIPITLK